LQAAEGKAVQTKLTNLPVISCVKSKSDVLPRGSQTRFDTDSEGALDVHSLHPRRISIRHLNMQAFDIAQGEARRQINADVSVIGACSY